MSCNSYVSGLKPTSSRGVNLRGKPMTERGRLRTPFYSYFPILLWGR